MWVHVQHGVWKSAVWNGVGIRGHAEKRRQPIDPSEVHTG